MPRIHRCSPLAVLLFATLMPVAAFAGGYDHGYDHDGYYDNGYDHSYDRDGYSDNNYDQAYDHGYDDQAYDYAGDRRDTTPNAYERSHDDDAYAYAGDSQDDSGVPYAGRDLGYDYVTDEYYRWVGPAPQDHRDREQSGYRDGVLHSRPAYRGRWYHYGCGCASYGYAGYGGRSYRQLDERQRDYSPGYTYSPRAYYRSWMTSRSDFVW